MFKNNILRTLAAVCVVLVGIIGWRIVVNRQNAQRRAESISLNRPVSVELGYPLFADIIPNLKFSGTLEPEWKAEVASKVDGRIEKVFVREGDQVYKGQVLARLEQVDTDADLLSAEGTYNDARANLEKAQLDYDRYEKLSQKGAVSRQTVDNCRFALDNAKGKLQSAEGVLQSVRSRSLATEIISPADGIVYKRFFQEGYYAKAATPVFAVTDISKLKISINIPEGNIRDVSIGNKAKIVLNAYPDTDITGTVTRIAPVADSPSHTFASEISVRNNYGLKAGVYATVYLKGVARRNVLCIPVSALVMRDDQRTVYVVDKNGVVSRKVLDVGYFDENYAEILSGLSADEVIVTGGQNKIREGNKVELKNLPEKGKNR